MDLKENILPKTVAGPMPSKSKIYDMAKDKFLKMQVQKGESKQSWREILADNGIGEKPVPPKSDPNSSNLDPLGS